MSAGTPYTSATEQTTNGAAPDVSTMKWGLVGVHNSWGTGDIPLVWDGTCGLYVAKSATLAGEFKVRADESWTTNFGSGGTVGVNNASATTVYNNGNNCSVTAGTYDVYFWYDSNNIKANGKHSATDHGFQNIHENSGFKLHTKASNYTSKLICFSAASSSFTRAPAVGRFLQR